MRFTQYTSRVFAIIFLQEFVIPFWEKGMFPNVGIKVVKDIYNTIPFTGWGVWKMLLGLRHET